MAHHAIKMLDGTVTIMQTFPQRVEIVEETISKDVVEEGAEPLVIRTTRIEMRETSIEECIAKWPPALRAKVVSHRLIDKTGIPVDRTFRNAWVDTGVAIVHDMPKARVIAQQMLGKDAPIDGRIASAVTVEDLKVIVPAEVSK